MSLEDEPGDATERARVWYDRICQWTDEGTEPHDAIIRGITAAEDGARRAGYAYGHRTAIEDAATIAGAWPTLVFEAHDDKLKVQEVLVAIAKKIRALATEATPGEGGADG